MRKIKNLLLVLVLPLTAFSQQTTGLFQFDWETEDGYTLFAPLLAGHNQYLLNNCGEVVHTWNSPSTTPANSMYLLEDGSMIYPAIADSASNNPINGGGAGERIIHKDWDGNILWDFIYYDDEKRLHHDIAPLPNGNVLAIAWVLIDSLDCIAAGRDPLLLTQGVMWSERVIEIEPTGPTTGNIVWQWDLLDHVIQDFDATKANYGVVENHPELLDINFSNPALPNPGQNDWIHLNSIDYNADLDQFILSSQTLNEVWIIDHSTTTIEAAGHTGGTYGKGGDFLYRYGNAQAYRRGTSDDQLLWRQHDANWIPNGYPDAGGIMIFNNGLNRTPGFSEIDVIVPPQTSPGVYELTSGEAYGPTEKTWNYHAPDSVSFYSYFISGAKRLPNGNTMICEGESGHIFEVSHDGAVVWDYVNPEEQWAILGSTDPITVLNGGAFHSNMVFRAEKYPADFSGFAGKDLSTGVQLESNPILDNCDGVVGVQSSNSEISFTMYPNPTTGFVTFENLDGARLSVYNSAGQLVLKQNLIGNLSQIDLEGQVAGIYAISIELNGKRTVTKLMVQ
ncbi:MAG: aryl-sulfate sulfotransferase [Flavobacteriales bacterium]|nr:aryl-sulfate sulfotransferase [Flavobacteriales bacterium]